MAGYDMTIEKMDNPDFLKYMSKETIEMIKSFPEGLADTHVLGMTVANKRRYPNFSKRPPLTITIRLESYWDENNNYRIILENVSKFKIDADIDGNRAYDENDNEFIPHNQTIADIIDFYMDIEGNTLLLKLKSEGHDTFRFNVGKLTITKYKKTLITRLINKL
ncbi:hypothetical protein [Pediococcus argentinicus]|uniref:Uncharacterized protein n=1 Tax=Pediococcus argentinicus TaxID=480391 RepID=A0A0R2NIC4_9LACO|nr:hypothetical protein [Pediococcus argentinicus]KRO24610.1 hypothetical protein IV88_GL000812 [Pediococcus argentinicus]NKZ22814.1 hypothetical protein [Pediococcus argentinicus]GEP19846.1 hypothetical protein LSA03_12300 [Pediococcus argentinicus]